MEGEERLWGKMLNEKLDEKLIEDRGDRRLFQAPQAWTQVKSALDFSVAMGFVTNTSKKLMHDINIVNATAADRLISTPNTPGGSFTRHGPGITIASLRKRRISQFSQIFSPD